MLGGVIIFKKEIDDVINTTYYSPRSSAQFRVREPVYN
jgi:hypothetical protein